MTEQQAAGGSVAEAAAHKHDWLREDKNPWSHVF